MNRQQVWGMWFIPVWTVQYKIPLLLSNGDLWSESYTFNKLWFMTNYHCKPPPGLDWIHKCAFLPFLSLELISMCFSHKLGSDWEFSGPDPQPPSVKRGRISTLFQGLTYPPAGESGLFKRALMVPPLLVLAGLPERRDFWKVHRTPKAVEKR